MFGGYLQFNWSLFSLCLPTLRDQEDNALHEVMFVPDPVYAQI